MLWLTFDKNILIFSLQLVEMQMERASSREYSVVVFGVNRTLYGKVLLRGAFVWYSPFQTQNHLLVEKAEEKII